ncbi:phenylalanine--tRNA ligase subunit alpha [Candidatus Ichthyocystis hellenicum]|uniref:phenylalanine--tRNA ligase subunit alpha n=1 Tax=Candidatus Ichthyocystis hellenicum TaxID=1561003 RepID=UPI000A817311|nr:phenylalanine--tRNA ligase subunit alpha [Candidatus Ichthyocystis hellenicum]
MHEDLSLLEERALSEIEAAGTVAALDKVKAVYIGKDGLVTGPLGSIKDLPPSERREVARSLNVLRSKLEDAVRQRRNFINEEQVKKQLLSDSVDCTLPARGHCEGGYHPLSLVMRRLRSFWHSAGFSQVYGPEVEDDWHNFTALNTPDAHPARSAQDTFYLPDGLLLRTHTSPIQIRHLSSNSPPVRVIGMGRVYRVDHDTTHSPMFHQIEGICVDENTNFSQLKGLMKLFVCQFFEDKSIKVRFRPSFFPFTEPSAEIDIFFQTPQMEEPKWLEIGGCGLINTNVLSMCNIDCRKYRGFAFGLGIERLAMLFYGIADLRVFYQNDLRFLSQFNCRGFE